MKYILFSLLLVGCGHKPLAVTEARSPNLLILGDSISLGYTPYLTADLRGVMEVNHPNDNCRSSAYTLEHLDEWLSVKNPTIITWNNGIWDCATATASTNVEYDNNLRAIGNKLLNTGAKIYFVTTTEIPEATESQGYIPGCERVRNAIAKNVMQDLGIDVIDLYQTSLINIEHSVSEDVHFNNAGYELLSETIINQINGDL